MGLSVEPGPYSRRPSPTVATGPSGPNLMREPMPVFGVALLDESRESGWACLGDTRSVQEPFRFTSAADLRNDCMWVISAESLDEFAPYKGAHNIRPGDYLATKLKYLAADYGLRVDGRGRLDRVAIDACRKLSRAIHCAMVYAAQCYPWNAPSQILRSNRLWEDVRKVLVQAPKVSQSYGTPLKSAYQSYSKVSMHHPPDHDVRMLVRFNRLEHAQRVMATHVPDPIFVLIQQTESGSAYPLEKALDPAMPCLVKATLEFRPDVPADIIKLVAFGESAGGRTGLRSWISQPELMWLSKFAHIRITEALVSEAARPLPPRAQLPELLTSDPIFGMSVPVGLVAETHWHALAEQPFSPQAEDKRETTLWATWLRAADRALCFRLAMSAYEAGFGVQGYGNGGVQITLPRSELPHCLEWALANEVAHPAFESLFIEHGLMEPAL